MGALLLWVCLTNASAVTTDTGDTGVIEPVTGDTGSDTGGGEEGLGRLEWAEVKHGLSAAEWAADEGGRACGVVGGGAWWLAIGAAGVVLGRRSGHARAASRTSARTASDEPYDSV
jgi:hypothetical protein